jgi:hypothetical protein
MGITATKWPFIHEENTGRLSCTGISEAFYVNVKQFSVAYMQTACVHSNVVFSDTVKQPQQLVLIMYDTTKCTDRIKSAGLFIKTSLKAGISNF